MAGCISTVISGQVASIKAAGRFPKRPVVAIDKHLIPRYDKKWRNKLVRSKRKGGTNVFETYITAQCVSMWELISFHAVFTMCVIAYAKEASVRHKA